MNSWPLVHKRRRLPVHSTVKSVSQEKPLVLISRGKHGLLAPADGTISIRKIEWIPRSKVAIHCIMKLISYSSAAKGVFSLAALEGVGILVVFCVLALDTFKKPDSIT